MANSVTIYRNEYGQSQIDVTENKTLDAAGCGVIQNVKTDGIVVTLPALAAGLSFTVRNGGATAVPAGASSNGTVLVAVSPNASDGIQGLGFTAADNKDALNTKATSRIGDFIRLNAGSADNWTVVEAKGIWTREA
mgnify:CR=1 FL=1